MTNFKSNYALSLRLPLPLSLPFPPSRSALLSLPVYMCRLLPGVPPVVRHWELLVVSTLNLCWKGLLICSDLR